MTLLIQTSWRNESSYFCLVIQRNKLTSLKVPQMKGCVGDGVCVMLCDDAVCDVVCNVVCDVV